MNAPDEHERQRARFAARYPRAVGMLEAQRVADVFSQAACELQDLTARAHTYDPNTFRRELRAIVAATVQLAVEAEGAES